MALKHTLKGSDTPKDAILTKIKENEEELDNRLLTHTHDEVSGIGAIWICTSDNRPWNNGTEDKEEGFEIWETDTGNKYNWDAVNLKWRITKHHWNKYADGATIQALPDSYTIENGAWLINQEDDSVWTWDGNNIFKLWSGNVLQAGANTYLLKKNGSTVELGPQLQSGGRLLKEDGTWFTPVLDNLDDVASITEAQGQIIYYDGSKWNALNPGPENYFLKTQGADANPVYVDVRDYIYASDVKQLFKQSSAPVFWTVDDTIQDNSMVVYRRSANYGADGGSQDPTSMTTPSQRLDRDGSTTIPRTSKIGVNIYSPSQLYLSEGASNNDNNPVYGTVSAVTLTPYYTHVIVATKD